MFSILEKTVSLMLHWYGVFSLPASTSDAVQWERCVCFRHHTEWMDSVSASQESQLIVVFAFTAWNLALVGVIKYARKSLMASFNKLVFLSPAVINFMHNMSSLSLLVVITKVIECMEEGEYYQNCLCIIIMVHSGTCSCYRSIDSIGLWSCLV